MVGLGGLFLAVNVYQVDIDWLVALKLILPLLFVWAGVLKLWRHFTWSLEKLLDRPGKAGLLSGIFWLSIGVVGTLAAIGFLGFLPTAGMYWPVILLLFGAGKIIDFFRIQQISRSSFGEIAGVIFIILFGLGCMKLHQLNVLILEQDPFWNRLPELLGIEELMDPVVEFSTNLDLELAGVTAVEISNVYGDVSVEGVSAEDGKGSAELISSLREKDEARAKAVTDQIQLEITKKDGVLFVTPNRKELKSQGKRVTTSVLLKVPDNLKLSVNNEYGDVIVSGMKSDCDFAVKKGELSASSLEGALNIKAESESVYLRGIAGDVGIDGGFSSIEIDEVTGNISVVTSHKSVRIGAVDGNLRIENRHDDVDVSGVFGAVEINNPGGEVSLSDITGQVRVVNSKGDVSISGTSGPVNLVTAYGDVELNDLGADVDVTSRYSDIEGRMFGSGVTIRGQNTEIDLENIEGNLVVETSQKPVQASDVRGSVNIQNDLGRVDLTLVDNPAHDIRVESRQGDIQLDLPPQAAFSLNARVTNGSIASEFGSPSGQDALGDSAFMTTVGENGPRIDLLTSGSVITIRRIQQ